MTAFGGELPVKTQVALALTCLVLAAAAEEAVRPHALTATPVEDVR